MADLTEAERRTVLNGIGYALIVPDRLRPAIAEVLRRRGKFVPVLGQREVDDTAKINVVARI